MTPVEIINKSKHPHPSYATEGSAGCDLRANLATSVVLKPLERKLIETGIHLALPLGMEAQIRPRSGMAFKEGITVLNAPGTIDADYRGEVKVLLVNLSASAVTISDGDRIAQMIIARHETADFKDVTSLSATIRGAGGFGSTGKKD